MGIDTSVFRVKKCAKCNKEKPLEEFYKNKAKKDGYRHDCKSCFNIKQKTKYQDKNSKYRIYSDSRRFQRHGITEKIYLDTLESQNGKCAICKIVALSWQIDHDHSCCPGDYGCAKCFRGVLCRKCNTTLGIVNDSKEILESALQYLENSSKI